MAMFRTTVMCAAGLVLGLAGVALSQDTPAPPSWSVLVRCAQMPSDDSRLSCYDAAMRAAGYAPKPEAVAAEHRKVFGLSMPKIGALKRKSQEEGSATAGAGAGATPQAQAALPPAGPENGDRVTVVLDKVALQGNGKLLFITADGAIWEQTDYVQVDPFPVSGQSMVIRKGKLGGYFCEASKSQAIRCVRDR